jgi:hypothetical protein
MNTIGGKSAVKVFDDTIEELADGVKMRVFIPIFIVGGAILWRVINGIRS